MAALTRRRRRRRRRQRRRRAWRSGVGLASCAAAVRLSRRRRRRRSAPTRTRRRNGRAAGRLGPRRPRARNRVTPIRRRRRRTGEVGGGCFSATPPPQRVRGGVFLANPPPPRAIRRLCRPVLYTHTHICRPTVTTLVAPTRGVDGVAVCASASRVYYIRYNVCAPYKYLYSRRCTRHYVRVYRVIRRALCDAAPPSRSHFCPRAMRLFIPRCSAVLSGV